MEMKFRHTYEWVMSHIWMSHVTHEWVMSHMKKSRHTYDGFLALYAYTHECHTHESVLQKSPIKETIYKYTWGWNLATHFRRIYIWKYHVMSSPCIRAMGLHSIFGCHTHEWVMSRNWMSHITHAWVITHMNESCHTWMSHVIHEWVVSHMNESCHTWMSHVTHEWVMSHMNESCHTWMSHITHELVTSHMNE